MFPSLIPMVFSGTFLFRPVSCSLIILIILIFLLFRNQVKIAAALLKLQITLARYPEAIFKTVRPA